MAKSKLRKKLLQTRSESDKKAYNKQRNKRVSLLKKIKKVYYSNLNVKDIVNNKTFWKTVKSFFSDKSSISENISLIENDNLLLNDFEIAETFRKYFQNLVPNLVLKVPSSYFAKHQKTVKKFYPQYINTRIIQVSKQSSENEILAFLSKRCLLLRQKKNTYNNFISFFLLY